MQYGGFITILVDSRIRYSTYTLEGTSILWFESRKVGRLYKIIQNNDRAGRATIATLS